MFFSRRQFMASAAIAGAVGVTGCTGRFGSATSYLTPILKPQYHNIVTHWCDVALQQIRDQRVPPPRAAYNLAMPTVAGFLAANGILQAYDDPFGIGPAPRGADLAMAYGAAFATAASEVFQQPFVGAQGVCQCDSRWRRQVTRRRLGSESRFANRQDADPRRVPTKQG